MKIKVEVTPIRIDVVLIHRFEQSPSLEARVERLEQLGVRLMAGIEDLTREVAETKASAARATAALTATVAALASVKQALADLQTQIAGMPSDAALSALATSLNDAQGEVDAASAAAEAALGTPATPPAPSDTDV